MELLVKPNLPAHKKKKRTMRSFEADEDVEHMLEAAIAAGHTITHLMNLAMRTHGPQILRGLAADMREKAEALEKKIPVNKH